MIRIRTNLLARSVATVFLGNGLSQLLNLVLVAFIAVRFELYTTGLYFSWLAAIILLSTICTLRSELLIFTAGVSLRYAVISSFAITVLISLAMLICLVLASKLGFSQAVFEYSLQTWLAILGFSLQKIFYTYLSRKSNYRLLSISRCSQVVINLALILVISNYETSISSLIFCYVLSIYAALFFFRPRFPLGIYFKNITKFQNIQQILTRNREVFLWSVPSDFLSQISSQLPLIWIAESFGAYSAGVFAVTHRYIFGFANLFSSSFLEVIRVNLIEEFDVSGTCEKTFKKFFLILSLVSLLFFLCGILVYLMDTLSINLLDSDSKKLIFFLLMPVASLGILASPLSYVVYVRKKQGYDFVWQLCLLLSLVLSFSVFTEMKYALGSFYMSYSVLYLVYTYMSYKTSK